MFACSVVAGFAALCYLGVLLWASNEASQPESIVAAQSLLLARHGTLYRDLNHYPYAISAYTPIFYCLEAALSRAGVPTLQAGRLVSFLATLGVIWLCCRIVLLYTSSRQHAWMAGLLASSTALVLTWGTVAQVDALALFFTVAAFYQFSRYYLHCERTLTTAGILAIAGFFTKQTMIAGPAAMIILLWFRQRKTAYLFAGSFLSAVLASGVLINSVLGGRFLENTVFANMNPLAVGKLLQHLQVMAVGGGSLLLVVVLAIKPAFGRRAFAPFVYLGFAMALLLATAPKVGSDSNYQLESMIMIVVCACIGLHALDFFRLLRVGSKSWVTLLPIPLGIHFLVNARMAEANLTQRIAREMSFRSQVAALRPYLAGGGRIISADVNAPLQLSGGLEVDPFIYRLLVTAGIVDPEPLRRDLADGVFGAVLLYEDVSTETASVNSEIPSLPASQIAEVRRRYTLVAHIPGPYQNGVYVYRPGEMSIDSRPR